MRGRALCPAHTNNKPIIRNKVGAAIEIATRNHIESLRQSDVDSLCALVSALNALRLLMADHAPITKVKAKELFAAGIEYLHRKDGLHAAVVSGMGMKRRLALSCPVSPPPYVAWLIAEPAGAELRGTCPKPNEGVKKQLEKCYE